MNFNDMHALAKRIDTQVKSLEAKVAHPMSMMYSNNSSQGVKVLSMLKDMIKDVETKKVYKLLFYIYLNIYNRGLQPFSAAGHLTI